MSPADSTPVDAAAESTALVRDFIQEAHVPNPDPLDPIRQSISQAVAIATKADKTAAEALEISMRNSNQLMGFSVIQKRTESTLNEHKSLSEDRHSEVLAAIAGAMKNDKSLAEKQAVIESKLSNADVGKIAGGVTALLVAIAGAVTLAATQLAPILPSVVASRYAQPAVVVTVQPSTSSAPHQVTP